MKIFHVAILVLAATFGGTAWAQLPFPFPGQPEPDLSKRPQCNSAYVQSIERQVAAMEQLRTKGPEMLNQLCTLLELGSLFPDEARRRLGDLLGIDVDLARAVAQCRRGQGNLERALISHLGYLKSELVRCSTI